MISAITSTYSLTLNDAQSVAHIANGSYSKAIQLIEAGDESQVYLKLFDKMMGAASSRRIKSIKEVADELSKTGREVQKSFLEYSLRMFREYFVSNFNAPELVYLNRHEQQLRQRYFAAINETNIEVLAQEFSLAHKQIEQNGNAKIIFLDLCLKLTMLIKK